MEYKKRKEMPLGDTHLKQKTEKIGEKDPKIFYQSY